MVKKNSMGLTQREYTAFLREQESIALQGARDARDPYYADELYKHADELRVAAHRAALPA